jgi:hypothetical protein
VSTLDRFEAEIAEATEARDAPRLMAIAHTMRRMAWSHHAAPRQRALVLRAGEEAARLMGYQAGIAQSPLWDAALIGPYGVPLAEVR